MVYAETWRLVAFLTMLVRFYLGAAAYAAKCKDEEYKLDLLFGIAHFILFYAWSITIPLLPAAADMRPAADEHWFRLVLFAILLYNVLWWVVRQVLVGTPLYMVRLWTWVNVLTALIGGGLFGVLSYGMNWATLDAELFVLILVIAVSWIDISEIIQYSDGSKGYFSRAMAFMLTPDPKLDDPPKA